MQQTSTSYWTKHNVTAHLKFSSAAESLEYFHWRNAQYHGYIELMPVSGLDDKQILDYGCGPGNDLVGFGLYSHPAKLIGMDVSQTSLKEAALRLELHQITAELVQIDEALPKLPLKSGSIDYIHSSGVLHHVPDPEKVLTEFRRIVKPDGRVRLMVYNYNSVLLHLYVAYIKKIVEGLYSDLDIREAFKHATDGPECPISRVYKPEEFIELARRCGFDARFIGTAISIYEMSLLSRRYEAIMNQAFPSEHRDFLSNLRFDSYGYARSDDQYAGVDGCYLLVPQ